MYYNSNKQTNDYYNSYKRELQELEAYEKQGKIQEFMKIIFLIVVLFLLGLASYYLYKYFNPDIETSQRVEKTTLKQNSQLPPLIIKENKLPKNPQLKTYQEEQIQKNAIDTIKQIDKNISITADKTTNISKKDIALIVQIVMAQINRQK